MKSSATPDQPQQQTSEPPGTIPATVENRLSKPDLYSRNAAPPSLRDLIDEAMDDIQRQNLARRTGAEGMPELRSQRYADTPAPDDTNTSNNVNVDTGVVGSGNPVRIDPAQGQTEGALREENPLGRGDQEMPGPRDSSDHPGVTVIHGTPKDAVTYIAPEKQEFFAPPQGGLVSRVRCW